MNTALDALATRLYVTIDDLLKENPDWQPERPPIVSYRNSLTRNSSRSL